MIDLGPYALYILLSYGGVAVLVAVLTGYVLWDARRVDERLRALEERGIRRRSAGPTP
jgi:heme exporter protein D